MWKKQSYRCSMIVTVALIAMIKARHRTMLMKVPLTKNLMILMRDNTVTASQNNSTCLVTRLELRMAKLMTLTDQGESKTL